MIPSVRKFTSSVNEAPPSSLLYTEYPVVVAYTMFGSESANSISCTSSAAARTVSVVVNPSVVRYRSLEPLENRTRFGSTGETRSAWSPLVFTDCRAERPDGTAHPHDSGPG